MKQPVVVKQKVTANRLVGTWGEDLAAAYLEGKGYKVLARNVRTQAGEIDLVARFGDLLAFVEVKTRRGGRFGTPEEAVNPAKQQRMADAAELWLEAHPEEAGDWQLHVIAIRRLPGQAQPEIVHLEGNLD